MIGIGFGIAAAVMALNLSATPASAYEVRKRDGGPTSSIVKYVPVRRYKVGQFDKRKKLRPIKITHLSLSVGGIIEPIEREVKKVPAQVQPAQVQPELKVPQTEEVVVTKKKNAESTILKTEITTQFRKGSSYTTWDDKMLVLAFLKLNMKPGDALIVSGYTCDLGSQELNDKLAKRRAELLANFLTGRGFDVSKVIGYGKSHYLTTDPAKRKVNRRVQIEIKHKTTKESKR